MVAEEAHSDATDDAFVLNLSTEYFILIWKSFIYVQFTEEKYRMCLSTWTYTVHCSSALEQTVRFSSLSRWSVSGPGAGHCDDVTLCQAKYVPYRDM